MPAIYKLETRYSKVNTWGWHRACELLEAIQAILASQGKPVLTADEICTKYPHLHPNKPIRDSYSHEPRRASYFTVMSDGVTCYDTRSDPVHWLQNLVDNDSYLPAKIGLAVIKAVKHPMLDKVARVLA